MEPAAHKFLLLHHHDKDSQTLLVDQVLALLNTKWPRSEGARRRTFENATDAFPHFVLFLIEEKVIGYAKISDCSAQEPQTALVESLIVDEKYRGKGYGKKIMEFCESHVVKQDFCTMALSTKDKQGFYEHIGYKETSKAITSLGSANKFLNAGQLSGLQGLFGGQSSKITNNDITWYRKHLL